ncbi:MAG: hypothetical protein ACRDNS_08595, partial [Trebonia sp.]
MKYMMIVCFDPAINVPDSDVPDIDDWVGEMDGRGVRLEGRPLSPDEATTVRVRNGEVLRRRVVVRGAGRPGGWAVQRGQANRRHARQVSGSATTADQWRAARTARCSATMVSSSSSSDSVLPATTQD